MSLGTFIVSWILFILKMNYELVMHRLLDMCGFNLHLSLNMLVLEMFPAQSSRGDRLHQPSGLFRLLS